MSNRSLDSVAFTLAVVLLAPAPVAGQSGLAAAKQWTAPRTPDGQPELQGIWTNATITPLERPKELAGKEFFTEQEAAEYEKRIVQNSNRDRRGRDAEADLGGAYNELWFDRGAKVVATRRTSLVVDPSDGKIPPLTPEAQKAAAARAVVAKRPPEGPALPVRCIVWPTSGRPHTAKNIRQWLGDSRGHWEGETLVVDTTNFTGGTHFMGSDQNLHLVERFTRTDANTIVYQFTVDDPTAFTKPWKAEVPLTKAPEPIYEYACHEGNYSMESMLRGARAQERAAAEAAQKKPR